MKIVSKMAAPFVERQRQGQEKFARYASLEPDVNADIKLIFDNLQVTDS